MIKCRMLEKKIFILTEDIDGKLYVLEADDYNELVNNYVREFNFVAANGVKIFDNAKVFFASYCGKPINPYVYTDFLSVMTYIREECCYKWENK